MSEQKFVNLASETQASTVQGSAISSAYTNWPILWAEEVMDAAKKRFFFTNFINTVMLPEGHHDYIVKKRTSYLGRSGITFDTGEATTSDISNTSLNTLDGVQLTPSVVTARFTVTNYSIRTNAFNVVSEAKAELSEGIGDRVDFAVSQSFGDATDSTNSVQGALNMYANDRNGTDNLTSGDILTTDLIAEAARYLKDSTQYYNNAGTITASSSVTKKNPWSNSPDDPFVLFIGPAQEMALRKDSQFVNASQYGTNEVVQNGEIGKYLGIRVVVTDNVERTASGSSAPDGNTAATDTTLCILTKPKKAVTLCWGQEPVIDMAPIQWRKQTSIVLETAYDVKVVHDDAVIKLYVADN